MIVKRKTVETVDVDWAALADELEKRVMAKLADDLETWKEDRSMRAMFLGDASNGLDVCEVVLTGKWFLVEERLWSMDTAARDYLYDWIDEICGADFFNLMRAK
jgi:hypothetical protein